MSLIASRVAAAVGAHIFAHGVAIVVEYVMPLPDTYYWVDQLKSYVRVYAYHQKNYSRVELADGRNGYADVCCHGHFSLVCRMPDIVGLPIVYAVSLQPQHLELSCAICGGRSIGAITHHSLDIHFKNICHALGVCGACYSDPYSLAWLGEDHGLGCARQWGGKCDCAEKIEARGRWWSVMSWGEFRNSRTYQSGCTGAGTCVCFRDGHKRTQSDM